MELVYSFNNNKSCIEICYFSLFLSIFLRFNNNKSCIEIFHLPRQVHFLYRLRITRVVLKYFEVVINNFKKELFNNNKSCIEIMEFKLRRNYL